MTFQININTDVLKALRKKINDVQYILYNKKYYQIIRGKKCKNKTFRAWDKICAIMDRLDDTVNYLNNLKLNTGKYNSSAFDFYDFMNNASVVIDCIRELRTIFDVDDSDIEKSNGIFNSNTKDNKGTDEKYFKYLRSLCSVHPIETSCHKIYQDNDFECCPYVIWNNNNIYFNNNYDLYAVVYTSKDNEFSKRIGIYISQIFEYVKFRINFLTKVIEKIESYHKEVILGFKKKHIKQIDEFNNYTDYLLNLEREGNERFGDEYCIEFQYIINLLRLKVSNPINENKVKLYINALQYSVNFEHNALQNMSYAGFDNSGIIKCNDNYEVSLISQLYSLNSESKEQNEYSYNFEKINYLNNCSGEEDKKWAYEKLKEVYPLLERYVSFEGANGDFEYYALVQVGLYLHCLENRCLVNDNIPNDLMYRENLL